MSGLNRRIERLEKAAAPAHSRPIIQVTYDGNGSPGCPSSCLEALKKAANSAQWTDALVELAARGIADPFKASLEDAKTTESPIVVDWGPEEEEGYRYLSELVPLLREKGVVVKLPESELARIAEA